MNFIKEGIRLKNALDEGTTHHYAKAWKAFADNNELPKYTASMLLLCEETGIHSLLPALNSDDVREIVVGMEHPPAPK